LPPQHFLLPHNDVLSGLAAAAIYGTSVHTIAIFLPLAHHVWALLSQATICCNILFGLAAVPHGDILFGLAAMPHSNILFRIVAVPHNDILIRLAAMPHGNILFGLAAVPHGDINIFFASWQ
jgi:hypothetical protein